MPFQSWTGPCFEIIAHFISECSISLLNLIVFVTARDIHGFLTLSSLLQIHENATELAFKLKEDFMQRRKVPDPL